MGDIIDFNKGLLKKKANIVLPTMAQLHLAAIEFLLTDWERMAKHNRLNDYFKCSLPGFIDKESNANFMNDLNEVAALELNLNLFPMMFSPGTTRKEQIGWHVQYRLGDDPVCTPELATEAYARCFGILLYFKLKRDAMTFGLIV